MKSVWKKVASFLVVSGLTAAEAFAQTGGYGAPSLLPLPETAPQFSSAPSYPVPVQRTAYTGSTVARYAAPTEAPAEPVSPSDPRPSVVAPPSPYGRSMAPSATTPTVNGGSSGDYQAAMNNPWSGSGSGCGSSGCGNSGCGSSCGCGCGSEWYAAVSGLVMTRDRGNRFWTSYETNRNDHQILNSESANQGWTGGVETTVGKWFGCGHCDALEVTYWGLFNEHSQASVRDENNNISTPMDLGFVNIGGAPASQFFDNAREHLIRRSDEFHNVEINWRHEVGCQCSCFDLNWISGFRYMNLEDEFHWFTVQGGHEFGDNGGVNEACLHIETRNNLYGFQVGSEACWHVTECFSLKATPKIGLMGDHVTNKAYLKRGDDLYTFDYDSSKDDLAMFGQLDLAADYQFGCHWHLFGGYRVLGISRVALSANQIPAYLNDSDGFKEVRTNSDLILHGAFAGAEFRW